MLELEIFADESDVLLWLDVANVGGSAGLANYVATAYPGIAKEVGLRKYPRWCEPAGALCTRLLAKALAARATCLGPTLAEFEMRVVLRPHGRLPPQQLERYRVVIGEKTLKITGTDQVGVLVEKVVPSKPCASLEESALYALKQLYWGKTRIPRALPLNPPVHRGDWAAYVRMGDLPEPVRTLFSKNMAHSSRPYIAEAPDAVYVWDWTDFLAGRR